MYANNPTNNVIVTPQKTATTTASTDEITENAPLMPQYHAVGAPSSAYCAFLIPTGNAMPMKKPEGKSIAAETAIRRGVDAAAKLRVKYGPMRMKAGRMKGSSQIQQPI